MEVAEFEQFIAQHGKSIYGFLCRLTNNSADADDLYQQTFLKAFEMLDRIDSEQYPKAYLISLALGIYRNEMRKSIRRERIAPTFVITDENEELLPSDVNVETYVVNNEETKLVRECIANLDDKFRIPLLLFYRMQMSEKDIAAIIKKPLGTVKTRLKRGRELLKKELEEHGYERS